jgi:hypothetical protein
MLKALEGFGNAALGTVQTLASPIRKLTGMAPATPPEAPTTTAGKIGAGVEQVGEFLVPEALAGEVAGLLKVAPKLRAAGFSNLVAKYGAKAVEGALKGAGAYATASHQGASTGTASVAGGLSAVSPVAGQVLSDAAPALKEAATTGMAKVLGAGKNISSKGPALEKDIAKAAPAALEMKLPTSWKDWATAAKMGRRAAGEALEDAKTGPAGSQLVDKQPVIDALDDLVANKASHYVPPKGFQPNAVGQGATGGVQQVVFNKPLEDAATALKEVLQEYPGQYMQARQLHDIKKMWDTAVYTGGEANQLGFQLADRLKQVDKLAKLTATNAIRDSLMADAPTIAALDQTVSQQIKLHQVIRQAAMARSAKTGLMGKVLSTVGTRAAGATIGGIVGEREGGWTGAAAGALLGGISGRMLKTAIESPLWPTMSPMLKSSLADAIASGNATKVQKALTPILAAMTAQIGGHVPPPTQSSMPASSGIGANVTQQTNSSAAGTPTSGTP